MSLGRAVDVPRTCRIHANPLLSGAARVSRHLGKVSHFFLCVCFFLMIFPRSVYRVSVTVPVPVPVPVCALVCLVGTDESKGATSHSVILGCLVESKRIHPHVRRRREERRGGGGGGRGRRRLWQGCTEIKYHNSNTTFSLTYDAVLILCPISLFPLLPSSFLPLLTYFLLTCSPIPHFLLFSDPS